MKKAITLRLCLVIVLSMLVTTVLSYYLQIKSAKDAMYNNSLIRIEQVSQIIEKNNEDIKLLQENLKEDYLIRAKAAAYIVQNHSEMIEHQEEMKKIVTLLQVDELHLFDKTGKLFAGSEPKYFNYTFNSGEQMQFFLPMLEDYELELCQEVSPNTAEGKLMQYLAVWREDRKGIVQIGMEPVRLLSAMKKNQLSHIFSMITTDKNTTIFAVNPNTGIIMGASDLSLIGKHVKRIGIDIKNIDEEETVVTAKINEESNYCVLKEVDQVLIGISSPYNILYDNIPQNMALVVLSLLLLSFVIIFLILRMLDRFVIHRIYEIVGGMKKIAAGDLDYHVEVANIPEFKELSSNINNMVASLLATTNKLSLVFHNVNVPIAVYEYNTDMTRVLVTNKIGEILMLSEEELAEILVNQELFCKKMQQICEHSIEDEPDVYILGKDQERYVKIKSYEDGNNTLGIIVNVTEDMSEKESIKKERDIDLLTGMLSRRAFFSKMDKLFSKPEEVKEAGILMIDLDNLKLVNDNWGHDYGDLLLSKAAELISECKSTKKVVSRLGGDEFVLVIYGAESKEEIQRYLDDLHELIRSTTIDMPNEETIGVNMSGGYIFYAEGQKNYRELLRLADQAMYKAKRGGKGYFAKYE